MRRSAPAFLDPLDFHLVADKVVELDRTMRYRSYGGVVYRVPEGFRCDLASVPWWLRSLAPDWRSTARSGVLHDCAYRWAEKWFLTREQADALFLEALSAEGVGWRRFAMWSAVRVGAARPWNRYRQMNPTDRGVKPPRVFP